MKKTFLVLTLATFTLAAFAQSSGSKFHFGIKAQPALAWFRIDAPSDLHLESDGLPFGFGYGLITDFGFSDHYAFSTGLEVVYRGGKTKQTLTETDSGGTTTSVYKTKFSLQFVELPISLKLKTSEIGYFTYFFQVGLQPGIAIRTKANTELETSDGYHASADNIDIGDAINEFNLSMILGAGAEYNISGNTSLLFGITFNNGFLDLLDDSGYNGEKVKANSNFLALTVGVLF